jgi:hypothetical protein
MKSQKKSMAEFPKMICKKDRENSKKIGPDFPRKNCEGQSLTVKHKKRTKFRKIIFETKKSKKISIWSNFRKKIKSWNSKKIGVDFLRRNCQGKKSEKNG